MLLQAPLTHRNKDKRAVSEEEELKGRTMEKSRQKQTFGFVLYQEQHLLLLLDLSQCQRDFRAPAVERL